MILLDRGVWEGKRHLQRQRILERVIALLVSFFVVRRFLFLSLPLGRSIPGLVKEVLPL